ncbi:hypothetical protein WICPIJ_009398 [Wickerhamomyces pijperi]|uniref:Uncharacterized protein n=1 Tax=Wickerhamomyces pijperi TaxID=599730 RepID=A0A9P8PMD0_WICPI|nr:hypothetical protein WICPIJ_009398 [Wickerhamomyces pijperi]
MNGNKSVFKTIQAQRTPKFNPNWPFQRFMKMTFLGSKAKINRAMFSLAPPTAAKVKRSRIVDLIILIVLDLILCRIGENISTAPIMSMMDLSENQFGDIVIIDIIDLEEILNLFSRIQNSPCSFLLIILFNYIQYRGSNPIRVIILVHN